MTHFNLERRPDDDVPDLILERYQLDELPAHERSGLRARLDRDARLARRLDALGQSNRDIATQYPPDAFARRARVLLGDRRGRRVAVTAIGRWTIRAAVAAALVLLAVQWGRSRSPETPPALRSGSTDVDRVTLKGLPPGLTLYRKARDGSETLADGARARAGDVLRVGYRAGNRSYGVILSIDGRGAITRHLPAEGAHAAALAQHGTVLLDRAFELDDAPKWERFYFVTAHAPFEVAAVIAAVRSLPSTVDAPPAPALPAALECTTFLVLKEGQP